MSGGTLLPFPEESRVVRARVRASVCVCVCQTKRRVAAG